MIGDALWRTAFGSDPDIVGSSITLDGASYVVTGVLAEGFEFATWDAQIYTPLVFAPDAPFSRARSRESFHMVARLRPDATVEQAGAELDALNSMRVLEYPTEDRAAALAAGFHSEVRGYLADLTESVRRPLLLLWIGALIVLVAAAANVTTLFLIRATGRRREISCRLAIGAGRSRVLRQLLTESLIVAGLGGLLGIALARWSLRFLTSFEVYEIPRVDDVAISGPVVAAGFAVALLLGTIAALLPARGLLWGKVAGLAAGARSDFSERPSRVHHALVGGQVAFAFVLVMTTGLLVESLRQLDAVEVGFDPAAVSVGATNLPSSTYPDATARADFARALVESVAERSDIEAAAVATQLPFSDVSDRSAVHVESRAGAGGTASVTAYRTAVTAGYFETMGIRLATGQPFSRIDDQSGRRVAIVDEQLARQLWPDGAPIGRRIWLDEEPGRPEGAFDVVGVVASIRQNSLADEELPGAVYLPFAQYPTSFFRVVTRTRGEVAEVPGQVADVMAGLDPSLLYYWVDVLEDSVGGSLLFRWLPMRLLSVFAGVSLLLVVLGVYGVTTHVVRARKRELGLRMALGGTTRGVARLLAKEWALVVLFGLGAGAVGMGVVLQAVRSLLFGTSGLDVSVVGATIIVVLSTAALSFSWPVRHAVRIDPARALQSTD